MESKQNINMQSVSSSNVDSVGYDDSTQTLYVRYLNNSLYIYKGVPRIEYDGLLQASSIGAYLHRNVKNLYPYERIE